ncbi:MAG: hypothetical protein ACI96M_003274, partial [Candidatus Azotimanducaceae bacterium]
EGEAEDCLSASFFARFARKKAGRVP